MGSEPVFARYGKAIVAVVIAVLMVASSAVTDGRITHVEEVQIAIAGVAAIQVWMVPNLPDWPGVKTGTAVVLAALSAAVPLLSAGPWSAADTINLVLAGLGAIGVTVAPAQVAAAVAGKPVARRRVSG